MRSNEDSRKEERGSILLMAAGLVAVLMLGAALSLTMVRKEADLQGQTRRNREAFFAAEAGLAMGKLVSAQLIGTNQTFTCIMEGSCGPVVLGGVEYAVTGTPTADVGDGGVGDAWYELIADTPYTARRISRGGTAVDDTVTTPSQEATSPNGNPYAGYPDQQNVRYRVFIRDDADLDGDRTADSNGRVWIVSVGEVLTGSAADVASGTQMPVRSVVEALVTAAQSGIQASGYTAQKGQGAAKSFTNTTDSGTPDLTVGTVL